MHIDTEVDASGLHCPLPLLKTRKALNELNSGQVLRVIATDPGSWEDFAAYVQQTQHELIEAHQDNQRFVYVLRKA